jgi:hypothetical protein
VRWALSLATGCSVVLLGSLFRRGADGYDLLVWLASVLVVLIVVWIDHKERKV